jgi:hypothetical protein
MPTSSSAQRHTGGQFVGRSHVSVPPPRYQRRPARGGAGPTPNGRPTPVTGRALVRNGDPDEDSTTTHRRQQRRTTSSPTTP